jgi:hypothetical protein
MDFRCSNPGLHLGTTDILDWLIFVEEFAVHCMLFGSTSDLHLPDAGDGCKSQMSSRLKASAPNESYFLITSKNNPSFNFFYFVFAVIIWKV